MGISSRRASMIGLLAVGLGVAAGADRDEPQPKSAGGPFPVSIRIDASKSRGEMKPVWRFFGHDEPNYTYMRTAGSCSGNWRP